MSQPDDPVHCTDCGKTWRLLGGLDLPILADRAVVIIQALSVCPYCGSSKAELRRNGRT